jgi:hypothetical protein
MSLAVMQQFGRDRVESGHRADIVDRSKMNPKADTPIPSRHPQWPDPTLADATYLQSTKSGWLPSLVDPKHQMQKRANHGYGSFNRYAVGLKSDQRGSSARLMASVMSSRRAEFRRQPLEEL